MGAAIGLKLHEELIAGQPIASPCTEPASGRVERRNGLLGPHLHAQRVSRPRLAHGW